MKARGETEIFLSFGLNEVLREGVMTGKLSIREKEELFWETFFDKNCVPISEGKLIVEIDEKVGWLRGEDGKLLPFLEVYRFVE